MKVLIGCETSGTVRDAFLAMGHDAWSCDLLPHDNSPEKHMQTDLLNCMGDGWDLLIAHPPCTYLCSSGMHWTTRGLRDPQLTEDALDFVQQIMSVDIPRVAIENPVGCISTRIRKADQYVQPYQFGDDASKKTGLWLKSLPLLVGTKFIAPRLVCCGETLATGSTDCSTCGRSDKVKKRWANQTNSGQNRLPPSPTRWKQRSKTYAGIAQAMAEQWGGSK